MSLEHGHERLLKYRITLLSPRTDLDEALPLNLVMGSSAFRLLANGICIDICEQLGTITGSPSLIPDVMGIEHVK